MLVEQRLAHHQVRMSCISHTISHIRRSWASPELLLMMVAYYLYIHIQRHCVFNTMYRRAMARRIFFSLLLVGFSEAPGGFWGKKIGFWSRRTFGLIHQSSSYVLFGEKESLKLSKTVQNIHTHPACKTRSFPLYIRIKVWLNNLPLTAINWNNSQNLLLEVTCHILQNRRVWKNLLNSVCDNLKQLLFRTTYVFCTLAQIFACSLLKGPRISTWNDVNVFWSFPTTWLIF